MKQQSEEALIGIIVYDGVEPIDIGGTVGVISMATRVLPALRYAVIAESKGPVRLASGLNILADYAFQDAPSCDVYVVTGGPGWREQVDNAKMLEFIAAKTPSKLASVCTGALILAASGQLAGKTATTRRRAVGAEDRAPLQILSDQIHEARIAVIVDEGGTVTSGGVSLAIDGMLYLLGVLYGDGIRDQIASMIEYDRAYTANRNALGHITPAAAVPS